MIRCAHCYGPDASWYWVFNVGIRPLCDRCSRVLSGMGLPMKRTEAPPR